MYLQAVVVLEKAQGADDPAVACTLTDLARVYFVQKHYGEALPPLQRALAIREKTLKPNHPDIAMTRRYLTMVQKAQAG